MDIINELWYGSISPFEQCTCGDERLKELLKLIARNVRDWMGHSRRGNYGKVYREVTPEMLKTGLVTRFIRSAVRIFAPML